MKSMSFEMMNISLHFWITNSIVIDQLYVDGFKIFMKLKLLKLKLFVADDRAVTDEDWECLCLS